jgi:thermitase
MYPTAYLITLSALIFWFYFKEQPKAASFMRGLFGLSMLAYLGALFLSSGLLSFKVFALFRDLIVMGLLAKLFSYFRENTLVFFGLFAFLLASYQFGGKSYMQRSLLDSNDATTTVSAGVGSVNEYIDPEGELLAELRPGSNTRDLQALVEEYGLDLKPAFAPYSADHTDLDDYIIVNIPDSRAAEYEVIARAISDHPNVESVELNELFRIDPLEGLRRTPKKRTYLVNDPQVNQQWGFDVMAMDDLYKHLIDNDIRPQQKTKLFIIDSGIEANHEDLQARYQSVKKAYDTDTNGHGTHCAGIAAAVTNNGLGIASVFPSDDFVEISSIKVMNAFGLIPQNRLITGIIEAVDAGADVISVSIGGRSREAAQLAFQKVVKYANDANSIIVVAAGNDNMPAIGYTPANAAGVITVSAIDTLVGKASFSNTVDELDMGIAAPGVNIYSTFPGNTYKALTGTSMACPQVAGLVGLLRSIDPSLNTKEAYSILNSTGIATKNTALTGRLVQPAKAVSAVVTNKEQ